MSTTIGRGRTLHLRRCALLFLLSMMFLTMLSQASQGIHRATAESSVAPPKLKFTIRIVNARYCMFTKDLAKLTFTVELKIKNEERTALTLRGLGFPQTVYVAKRYRDVSSENYEFEVTADTLGLGPVEQLEDINKPIQHGDSLNLKRTNIFVPVSLSQSHDGIDPGEHYLQVSGIAQVAVRDGNGSLLETNILVKSSAVSFRVTSTPEVEGCR